MSLICPTLVLLLAILPCALGYEPPSRENGGLYLKSILSQTSDRTKKAVHEALEHMEERLETRLAAQTAALDEKITALEGRLTASCSVATKDIGDLVSAFMKASSQMAGCCESPATTPTVRPSTTPTERPSTTPTVRPSTTPTVRPSTTPTVRPSTTPTVRPSTTPTVRPSTTPTTTPTTTPSPTTTPTTTPATTVRPTTTPTTPETPRGVVFLRRQDGSEDFYRNWAAYKSGFGNQAGEFWLGLDNLHTLTNRQNYGLRADLTDWSGETKWEEWSTFRVAGEGDEYRLTVSGYSSSSTAGGSMSYNDGERFSTRDRENDLWNGHSCAFDRQGGWWYRSCTWVNPTGPYKPAGYRGEQGIEWYHAYDDERSFKRVTLTLINL